MPLNAPPIVKLPESLIDQIAAGEVIEGPLSVVKELVENALDANASTIDIHIQGGGYSEIVISDNGWGISCHDLPLALLKHATSKMTEETLWNIRSLGFRGEALSVIRAVSRLRLESRTHDNPLGFFLTQDVSAQPVKRAPGTRVCVRDLFYNTPARLKFAKSERAFRLAFKHMLIRYALCYPHVAFKATLDGRDFFEQKAAASQNQQEALQVRQKQLLPHMQSHGLFMDAQEKEYRVFGLIAPPTEHVGTRQNQYLFIQRRPVQDKLFSTSLSLAFQDVIPHGRYPWAILFLDVPPSKIDVNVHPTKQEVRFAEPRFLQNWLTHTIKAHLHGPIGQSFSRIRPGATFTKEPLPLKKTPAETLSTQFKIEQTPLSATYQKTSPEVAIVAEEPFTFHHTAPSPISASSQQPSLNISTPPLGRALGQIHGTYIIAESEKGLVIIDQHAAAERLLYEKLKTDLSHSQPLSLLVPEFMTLDHASVEALRPALGTLKKWGLHIESHSPTSIVVYSVPTLLKETKMQALVQELADTLSPEIQCEQLHDHDATKEAGDTLSTHIDRKIWQVFCHILGERACKNSIKAHKKLSVEEINQLLRDMEETALSGQCNHGRPTSVLLTPQDLARLFKRT